MKQWFAGIIVLLVLAGVAAGVVLRKHGSPAARQERAVRNFVAILPDSIDSEHRLEIQQLFYMFYQRAARGDVAKEDVERINDELARYTNRGRITPSDLVHFMADVGYTTYKGDPKFNLPDKSVDHPILNPSSAMYSMRFNAEKFDSAFWADFTRWKAEHPEMTDSMLIEELLKIQKQQDEEEQQQQEQRQKQQERQQQQQ
jgi:hypothetical protein